MSTHTPKPLRCSKVRIARPTDRLHEVVTFYRDTLGLRETFRFEGHAGYDGVIFTLPNGDHEIEFTTHIDGSPCPAPTTDNLLVFYVDDHTALESLAERFTSTGHAPVVSENPYWTDHAGLTFEDPDGWRVVLIPTNRPITVKSRDV